MPVRNFTRLFLWLCALFIVHLGDPLANAAGSASPDRQASTLALAEGEVQPPQDGSRRAEPERKLSDKQSGIPESARETLKALTTRHGEPSQGYVGGRTFHNRERILPRGRYREYDVHPKLPGKPRGAERIVIEQHTGKAYYTADHYRSFIPMN